VHAPAPCCIGNTTAARWDSTLANIPLPTTRTRILLVDDDERDYVLTQRLLERIKHSDHRLDWAPSFEAGLEALVPGKYDACLVDYQLGPRNGLDLMREVTARGVSTPMILITAHGDSSTDARAQDLGAAGYLEKRKVDPQALDRAVRYAVSRESLVSDLIDQNTELLRLHRLTELLLKPGPSGPLLQRAAAEIAKATAFPVVAIETYDPRQRRLREVATFGLPDESTTQVDRPVESTMSGRVVLEQCSRMEVDLASDPATRAQDLRWAWARTWVCIPIVGSGQIQGALTLAHRNAVPVDSTQVTRSTTLAMHLGLLIGRLDMEPDNGLAPTSADQVDLTEDLNAILDWYDEEARRRGLQVQHEPVSVPKDELTGDRTRLGHVLPLYLSAALRHASHGALRVQTFPSAAKDHVLVSFEIPRLAASTDRVPTGPAATGAEMTDVEASLESCRRMTAHLGGTMSTWDSPEGGMRVGLGMRV
jgi:CheY-like chemotaxis protein